MSVAQNLQSNPLVNPPKLPHGAPPFDAVKTGHFLPALDWAVEQVRAEIEAIKTNPDLPTFENTIEALEFSGGDLRRFKGIFDTFKNSNSSDKLRAIEKKVTEKLEKFMTEAVDRHGSEITLDDALFVRIDAVYKARAKLNLDPEQTMLLENTYNCFVRRGALLGPAEKQRYGEISDRLAALTVEYRNNDVKATESFKRIIDDEVELDGVPQRAKDDYKKAAEDAGLPGKWLLLLEPYPSEIVTHGTNRSLREELHAAVWAVGNEPPYDNRPIALEMVRLRHEAARLLGYDTHADYILADRMAGSRKTVEGFLEKNLQAYKPSAEAHLEEIKACALKTDGITNIKPWDIAYYSRILEEEKFDLDQEELRPYFDLEKVLDGLRQHAEKLFGVTMKEAGNKYPVYNTDVKAYEIQHKKTGQVIGLFYANYYAAPGVKRGGAWMNPVRDRGQPGGQEQIPVVTNDCNYPKPINGRPVLLSLGEVETIYHEFGHALHGLCSTGKYPTLNGANTKWDWVELPSQLQENWVQQKEVLDTFAIHANTGQPMPQGLFQKMKDMQNFGAGYAGLRQTFLGLLDMAWHTTDPATITSVEALEDPIFAKASLMPRGRGTYSGSFSHLFGGGYDAGYYSYKWAEVLEADVFERFKTKGLYDRDTADAVKRFIYEAGGKTDPAELFRKLMGRDPDPEALFRREGIAAGPAAKNQSSPPPAAPKP